MKRISVSTPMLSPSPPTSTITTTITRRHYYHHHHHHQQQQQPTTITVFLVLSILLIFLTAHSFAAVVAPKPVVNFGHNPNLDVPTIVDSTARRSVSAQYTDQIHLLVDIADILDEIDTTLRPLTFTLQFKFSFVNSFDNNPSTALPFSTVFNSVSEWDWSIPTQIVESLSATPLPQSSNQSEQIFAISLQPPLKSCIYDATPCTTALSFDINSVFFSRGLLELYDIRLVVATLSFVVSDKDNVFLESLPFNPSLSASDSIPFVPTPTQLTVLDPTCALRAAVYDCELMVRGLEGHFNHNDAFSVIVGTSNPSFVIKKAAQGTWKRSLDAQSGWTSRTFTSSISPDPVECLPSFECIEFGFSGNPTDKFITNMMKFGGFAIETNDPTVDLSSSTVFFAIRYTAVPNRVPSQAIVTSTFLGSYSSLSVAQVQSVVLDQQWTRFTLSSSFGSSGDQYPADQKFLFSVFHAEQVTNQVWLEGCTIVGASQSSTPSTSPGMVEVELVSSLDVGSSLIEFECIVLLQSRSVTSHSLQVNIVELLTVDPGSGSPYADLRTVYTQRMQLSGAVPATYNYLPLRLPVLFNPNPSDKQLTLDVMIPDLCSWARGDAFTLSSTPIAVLSGVALSSTDRPFWTCSQIPGGIRCELRVSSPCRWSAFRTDPLMVVRGLEPLPMLTTQLVLQLVSSDVPSSFSIDFSTQFVTETVSTLRNNLFVPINEAPVYTYIPSTIFPANTNWAASKYYETNVALTHDNSLFLSPLRVAQPLAGSSFSYCEAPVQNAKIRIVNPILTLVDSTLAAQFNLDVPFDKFAYQVHDGGDAFNNNFDTTSALIDSTTTTAYQKMLVFSQKASPQVLQELDSTALPRIKIKFSDGSLCRATSRSCFISHMIDPTDQFIRLSRPEHLRADITLLSARLSVGRLPNLDERYVLSSTTPASKLLADEVLNNHLDTLDQISFEFGTAPAFLTEKTMPTASGLRDKVFVVVRSLGGNQHFAVSPNPALPSFGSPHQTKLIEGNVPRGTLNNLHCVWNGEFERSDSLAPTLHLYAVKATSPDEATLNRYTYGTGATQWTPSALSGSSILGVYNLPDLNKMRLGPTPDQAAIPNLRLTCYTLFDGQAYMPLNKYSFEVHGPDGVIAVPFAQRFYAPGDNTVQPERQSIDTELTPLTPPRSQSYTAGLNYNQGSATPAPTYLNHIDSTIDLAFTVGQNAQLQRGDKIKVELQELPVWLDTTKAKLSCGAGDGAIYIVTPTLTPNPDSVWLEYSVVVDSFVVIDNPPPITTVQCSLVIPRNPVFRPTRSRHSKPYYPTIKGTFTDVRCRYNANFCNTGAFATVYTTPFFYEEPLQPCPEGSYGSNCQHTTVTIPPTAPIQTLPPPPVRLPSTTADPTAHCHVVVDVNGVYQRFNSSYTRMCSIPTSGVLTTAPIGIDATELPTEISAWYKLNQPKLTTLNVCDCNCNGYWWDEPTTLDFKKCTQCIVPDGCPNTMTPNGDCTACECTTPLCRKLSTYAFSTMYFTPQLLKTIVTKVIGSGSGSALTAADEQEFLLNPLQTHRAEYRRVASDFSKFLLARYQSTLDKPEYTSRLESISISPLIEGSYTAWKLTFGLINTAELPMSRMAPLYGLAPFPTVNIAQLFVEWCFETDNGLFVFPDAAGPSSAIGVFIQQNVRVPVSKSPGLTKLALFTADTVTTQCLSYTDHLKLTTNPSFVVTPDLLRPCPLPNQFIPTTTIGGVVDQSAISRHLQLNPLWSPCSGWSVADSSSSSSPPKTEYMNYENLLDQTPTVARTTLSTRQIYPYCFDFAGTNLGSDYAVTCQIPFDLTIYSTQRNMLMNPSSFKSLLSSFNMLDIPPSNTIALERLAKLKITALPKYPQFPQSTVVLCPEGGSPTSPLQPQQQRCPVGKYGQSCQFDVVVEHESLSASPTRLTIDAHSHISWAYQGDNIQEVTLVMKPKQKANDGTGQFGFSQTLGTVPLSYLYSTPQVPTFTNSVLFRAIYDILYSDDVSTDSVPTDDADSVDDDVAQFKQVYGSADSTTSLSTITIEGYLTNNAKESLVLNPQNSDSSAVSLQFELPLVCDQLNVSCSDASTQYCYQGNGRCACRSGYYNAVNGGDDGDDDDDNNDDDDEIEYPYQTGPNGTVIDGSRLNCVPICQNDQKWNKKTKQCVCASPFTGEFCEELTTCDHTACNNHGFIPQVLATGECDVASTAQCQCRDHWSNRDSSLLSGYVAPPPKSSSSSGGTPAPVVPTSPQCSFCSLRPFHYSFYTESELEFMAAAASSTTTTTTNVFGGIDGMYNQTYSTTTTSSSSLQQQQPQRCYVSGTEPAGMADDCTQCQCRRGYGGKYCQLHVAYAKFPYTKVVGVDYNYDATSQQLFYAKFLEEVSLSMLQFKQSNMFIAEHNRDSHYVIVGFFSGLDFFQRNAELIQGGGGGGGGAAAVSSSSSSSLSFATLANNNPLIPTGFNPTLPVDLDSLYTQWGDLQTQFPTTPIKNQDSDAYLGGVDPPEQIQDPSCFEQSLLGCSGDPPKRASSKALLIGLVVGLVCGILLFLFLVLALYCCKKHSCGLWKSEEAQRRDEMSSFAFSQPQKFNGSTKAPEMTIGTLSIVPLSGGLEMSTHGSLSPTAKSVQSVNNHTEVKDETLPPNVKAYKDTKGQVFYVNSETMTTSWNHPKEVAAKTGDGGDGGDDYGSGW